MAKLSVIVPSRDERFLVPTIEDIFRNARGEIEVIAVLDSPNWPENWADVTAKYPNLHTIHNGKSLGMRASINRGVASAISRRAKFIMKTDAHCSFSEGFDVVLQSQCEPNWVVIPRRGRLDPEQWTATDTHKPDIDYHYLSFPDDPNDFGGPGLNGKVWAERAVERRDILIDEEMSSQGSCWFTTAKYFNELELMDEASYGMFWNEMQEILLKCWLSGGQGMVNKKAKYLHLHKGRKYGRGYKLPESELTKGATYTKRWLFNEAWPKQTLPFKTLIERFWPVPTWPEDWEEKVYGSKGSVVAVATVGQREEALREAHGERMAAINSDLKPQLQIHSAYYGIFDKDVGGDALDITNRVRGLVANGSLDIVVNNATLIPNENPFRGHKKRLRLTYSIDGGEKVTIQRQEKEWLIIGPVRDSNVRASAEGGPDGIKLTIQPELPPHHPDDKVALINGPAQRELSHVTIVDTPQRVVLKSADPLTEADVDLVVSNLDPIVFATKPAQMTAAALNDFLVRKFHISDRRLRAPMPVELRDFNRNDLAKLFAELGFKYGAEIGVAEGHYSEILCQSIPDLDLRCVDPWHRYDGNPRAHSEEHQRFSLNETKRKLEKYNVQIMQMYSMNAVQSVAESSLDFVYVDANHQFDYVMQDLIEWSKRVRSGGIVAGDDYYAMKRQGGVVAAVDAYTKAHGIALWFICDAPNSVDFFFVKP